ncbi:hypothetical protein [Micromonospora aurantiaca (nom. illeg.)]|uniref:hypothetical protein n=1 Tax=Micromonospora aurantiaca (nom. illeg.) TaxID=47850 RepID=UPI00059EF345|nr:hypothetical protein [Micromonospora aurantiaca]
MNTYPLSVHGVPFSAASAFSVLLVAAVYAQDLHAAFVEGDRPPAGGGLGLAFDDLVAGGGAVAFDGQDATVEIDVGPPQPAQLTTAQPAQPGEPPEGEQGIVVDGAEELGELVGGPDRHRRPGAGLFPGLDAGVGPDPGVGLLVAGDLDVPGRVAVQDSFLDREVEGGPQSRA